MINRWLGGYDKLEFIRLEEIVMDFSGGVTESMTLEHLSDTFSMKQVAFFEKLQNDLRNESVVIFCTKVI